MHISLKRIYINTVNLMIFFLLICGWIYYYNVEIVPENWSIYVSIVACILIVIQIYEMLKFNIGIQDFIFWYIILQFIFYYGRIFVYALGMDYLVPWKLFLMYSEVIIFKSSLFTLCFSQGIFLGFMLFRNIRYQSNQYLEYKRKYYTSDILFRSGVFMFLITFPFEIYKSILTISSQRNGEYVAVINISGLLAALGFVSVVAILVIITSKKLEKKQMIRLVIIYAIYQVVYMSLSGDRRQAVTSFIVIGLCIFNTYDIKLKLRVIIPMLVVGYVMFIFLAAIKMARQTGISIDSIKDAFIEVIKEGNIFVEVFGEFGSTFFTIVNSMTYYPSNYEYIGGKTYLASLLIMIPGIFTYLFPKLFARVTIPENMQLMDGNPIGGSLGQDLYANFGALGIIGTVVIGMLLSKFTQRYKNASLVDNCRYYIVFLILINLVRAGIYEVTRTLMLSLVLFEFSCIICRKKIVRYSRSSR